MRAQMRAPGGDPSGTLALLLALGVTESEAVGVVERFFGRPLAPSPQGIVDQTKTFLAEYRA